MPPKNMDQVTKKQIGDGVYDATCPKCRVKLRQFTALIPARWDCPKCDHAEYDLRVFPDQPPTPTTEQLKEHWEKVALPRVQAITADLRAQGHFDRKTILSYYHADHLMNGDDLFAAYQYAEKNNEGEAFLAELKRKNPHCIEEFEAAKQGRTTKTVFIVP